MSKDGAPGRGVSEIRSRNVEIARRLWQGASEGDPNPILELHPEVTWRNHGQSHRSGVFRGIDQVLRSLATFQAGLDHMRLDMQDILASERGAVILYRLRADRGLRAVDGFYSLWLRIEDEVIREVVAVPFDQAADDRFWQVD